MPAKKRLCRFEPLEARLFLAVTAGSEGAVRLGGASDTVWMVNTCEDELYWNENDGILSLREAVMRAASGDTISFDPLISSRTLELAGFEIPINKTLTIDASPIGGFCIDAWGASRIFRVAAGTLDSPVILNALTFIGGRAETGGAVYNTGVLTITDSVFLGNSAETEGGAVWSGGTLTLTGTEFSRNSAETGGALFNMGISRLFSMTMSENLAGTGGAVSNSAGIMTVTDSFFIGNRAESGGAFYSVEGGLDIVGTEISENQALVGGGIHLFGGGLAVTDSFLLSNRAETGGGLYSEFGTVSFSNTLLSENEAVEGGGYYGVDSFANFERSTFSLNAAKDGGGICNYFSSVTAAESVFWGNSAERFGGALYDNYGELALTESTVAGNTAACGGGIYDMYGDVFLNSSIVALNAAEYDPDIALSECFVNGKGNAVSFDPGFLVPPVFSGGKLSNPGAVDLALAETSIAAGKTLGAFPAPAVRADGLETPSTVVTTAGDTVDPSDGLISLREALFYAKSGDTVTFSSIGRTVTLGGAPIWIDKPVTIDGRVSLNADGRSRVLVVTDTGSSKPVTLAGLTITGGEAECGGGIYNSGILEMSGCRVAENRAVLYLSPTSVGGGVCNEKGTLTLTGCTVANNEAECRGGGISSYCGTVTLDACRVAENACFGNFCYGAGVYVCVSPLTMTNCSVTGNRCGGQGGGLFNSGAASLLTNCTIAGNESYSGGGYCGSFDSSALFRNSIIAGNWAPDGSDILLNAGSAESSYSLSSFTQWRQSVSPMTCDPALPLFENPLAGNYRLAFGSPAIDAGRNADAESLETDLDGESRIVNGTVDLGAYEYRTGSGGSGQGTDPELELASPEILTGSVSGLYPAGGGCRHLIRWSEIDGAEEYEIAWSENGAGWKTFRTAETERLVSDLTPGTSMTYRVRAAAGEAVSAWSESRAFLVCPVDVNGDGSISGLDRALMARAWLSEEGDANWLSCCDVDGDGEITGLDRAFLARYWLMDAEDLF